MLQLSYPSHSAPNTLTATVSKPRNANMAREMTMSEALSDPLIALVNKADGIDHRSFAQLLESASRVRSVAKARPK